MGCDEGHRYLLGGLGWSFSILERIEWAATSVVDLDLSGDSGFQYPRTDRMGCDSGAGSR